MRTLRRLLCLLCLLVPSLSWGLAQNITILVTFQDGQALSAAQLNNSFQHVIDLIKQERVYFPGTDSMSIKYVLMDTLKEKTVASGIVVVGKLKSSAAGDSIVYHVANVKRANLDSLYLGGTSVPSFAGGSSASSGKRWAFPYARVDTLVARGLVLKKVTDWRDSLGAGARDTVEAGNFTLSGTWGFGGTAQAGFSLSATAGDRVRFPYVDVDTLRGVDTLDATAIRGTRLHLSAAPVGVSFADFATAGVRMHRAYARIDSGSIDSATVNVLNASGEVDILTASNFKLAGTSYTGTMANLNTLRDDSMADALHRHSELSASDGTPDRVISLSASGAVTFSNGFTAGGIVRVTSGGANITGTGVFNDSLYAVAPRFEDVHYASGAVRYWNGTDVTETHAANTLTWAGATSGYVFNEGSVTINASLAVTSASSNSIILTTGANQNATLSLAESAAGAFSFHYYTGSDYFDLEGPGGAVFTIGQSVNDIAFQGGISTDGQAAPTSGIVTSGPVFINETANAGMTIGLTINQGANDNEIVSLKSSDVAHGVTALTETDTYFAALKNTAVGGGVQIYSLSDADMTPANTLYFNTTSGVAADATKSTAGRAIVEFFNSVASGTGQTTVGANGNMVAFKNGGNTLFIFDADGDSHQDVGTAWTNFDAYDDAQIVRSVGYAMDPESIIKSQFDDFNRDHKEELIQVGLIPRLTPEQINRGERPLMNTTQLARVHNGAIWQNYERIRELQDEVSELRTLATGGDPQISLRQQIADMERRLQEQADEIATLKRPWYETLFLTN